MAACGSIPMSGRLPIGLPGVDRTFRGRVALATPQFAPIETHGVKPLRVLAGSRRVAVRKNVTADDALDRADMAAHVSGQAGVRRRIDILRAHFLARL